MYDSLFCPHQIRHYLFTFLSLCALSATMAFSGCSEDVPGCRADDDCRAGRVCASGLCQAPNMAGGSNGTSSSNGTSTGGTSNGTTATSNGTTTTSNGTTATSNGTTMPDADIPDTPDEPDAVDDTNVEPDTPNPPDMPFMGPNVSITPAGPLNFGETPLFSSVFKDLAIRNDGDETLVLIAVRLENELNTSFELRTPNPEPSSLEPGETAMYQLLFQPTRLQNGQNTSYQRLLIVETNDPDTPEVSIQLEGVAIAEEAEQCITFDRNAINFGVVSPGNTPVEEIALRNCGDEDVSVNTLMFDSDSPGLDVILSSFDGMLPSTLGPEERLGIIVAYQPAPQTSVETSLVATTAEGAVAELPISGSASESSGDLSALISLTWDNQADMDLHVVRTDQNGNFEDFGGNNDGDSPNEIYWGNMSPDWGFLDIDDRDGFGPENITLPMLNENRRYRIGARYSNRNGSEGVQGTVNITIGDQVHIFSAEWEQRDMNVYWVPAIIGGDGSVTQIDEFLR